MGYILLNDRSTKRDFENWLNSTNNRSHFVYLAWRMCLRKVIFIDHEIQEWNGNQEIIFKNYLLPCLRGIFVSRFIGGLGKDAERVENYAGEAIRHLDSFLEDIDAAMGTAILCNMCQRLSLLCAQSILNFRKILSDIFGLMSSIDSNNDNFAEEVFIDIANLETGGDSIWPLFSIPEKQSIFEARLEKIISWAEEVDPNSMRWFDWIKNVASTDYSLDALSQKSDIFDFIIGTKPDEWWRMNPTILNQEFAKIYDEFDTVEVDSLEKYLPEWGAKRRYITMQKKYDFFISHASEDKDKIARPLFEALESLGFKVWFDEQDIQLGSSIRTSIDNGLIASKFGIVIISEAFFKKNWTQLELDALFAREVLGQRVILPVWYGLSYEDVVNKSPIMASKLALIADNMSTLELSKKIANTFFKSI